MTTPHGAPELPPITDEDRQFLHYNPNTDDLVEFVQNYARAAIQQAAGAVPEGHLALLDEMRAFVNLMKGAALEGGEFFSPPRCRQVFEECVRLNGRYLDLAAYVTPGAPNEAMLCAGARVLTAGPPGDKYTALAGDVFRAMLAASPSPLGREAGNLCASETAKNEIQTVLTVKSDAQTEAGSSDHLVLCAGGGVTQPTPVESWMADAKRCRVTVVSLRECVRDMAAGENRCRGAYQQDYMRIPVDYLADAYAEAGKVFRRYLDPLNTAIAPRPDAPTSQIKKAPADQTGYHDPARIAAWNAANPDINPGSAPREDGHG